jgi:plasmid stabilization system protein ParE
MAEVVGKAGREKSPAMKIVWSRRPIRHLVYFREDIEKDSEQNAALVASRILKPVDLLQTHPEMGRPGRVVGSARACGSPNALHHSISGAAEANCRFPRTPKVAREAVDLEQPA